MANTEGENDGLLDVCDLVDLVMEDFPGWACLEDFPAVGILDDVSNGSSLVAVVLAALSPRAVVVVADFPLEGPFFLLRLPGGEKHHE